MGIAKKIRDSFSVVAPEIDGRADIYSLGIILYKMLSGTDPFSLDSQTQQVCDHTGAKIHTSQPPQPLRSQPGCEQMSSQLEAVVHKCLQISPEGRFATMAQLKQALEMAIAERPTDSTSTSSSNTIFQLRSLTTSDSPTIFRQVIPSVVPGVVEPTIIAPISTGSAPSSPDQTIYQNPVSPAPSSPDQTIYQDTVSPTPSQPNQTIYQGVASPRRDRSDQTIYQGVNSSTTQNDADKTIYQRQPLLPRLGRIPRQIWKAILGNIFNLTCIVRRFVRKIKLWIRSHQARS